MIIIKVQSGNRVKRCSDVYIGKDEDRYIVYGMSANSFETTYLGTYSTEEKAKEIINGIFNIVGIDNLPIFEMPQDE